MQEIGTETCWNKRKKQKGNIGEINTEIWKKMQAKIVSKKIPSS